MESMEDALPPRERLELTVNGLFNNAELYDGLTVEHSKTEEINKDLLVIPSEKGAAIIIRELDDLDIPQSYIVAVRDTTQLSQGFAGLAWCTHDEQFLPREFDSEHVMNSTSEDTITMLADWLQAQAERRDHDLMPPNPFGHIYETQEVTVGTINNELTEEDLAKIQHFGIVAAYLETISTLVQPILPPISHVWGMHNRPPEEE